MPKTTITSNFAEIVFDDIMQIVKMWILKLLFNQDEMHNTKFYHCWRYRRNSQKLSKRKAESNMVHSWKARGHLTHWGWLTHIFIGKTTIIGLGNVLSHGGRHAIVWTNSWISLTEPLGINFSDILVEFHRFSFKKIRLENGGHFVSASMC